jgi:hypothetical protein
MLRFCELDEGDVIEVPMSGNATLTRATIEFVDGHIEWFTEYALHISRARVVALSLAPPGERRGTVKVELELEEPPLKGPSRERRLTTFESFHHTGRFARHLPKIRKTTLSVGDSVFYFDMGRRPPLTAGSHIENVSDRGAEILRALGKL